MSVDPRVGEGVTLPHGAKWTSGGVPPDGRFCVGRFSPSTKELVLSLSSKRTQPEAIAMRGMATKGVLIFAIKFMFYLSKKSSTKAVDTVSSKVQTHLFQKCLEWLKI